MKQSDMQKHKVGQKGVIKSMKMKEVRDFVDTYNKHFLTNWAAEELLEDNMKYNKTFREALNEVRKIKEDGHTDVTSAVRQSKTSIEDASQMLMKLQRMNPDMLYQLVDEQT